MSSLRGSRLSNFQIRSEGWKVLTERLGISGAMRFMMQYDPGYGDYAKERAELLEGLTLDEAIQRLRATRRHRRAKKG